MGIGLAVDGFSLGAEAIFGFFVIAPLTVLVLVMLFEVCKIRNEVLIVLITTLVSFLAMMFGFFQWIELRGNGGHMSGLLYYVGVVPSVIIGVAYGFYLARKIRKQI